MNPYLKSTVLAIATIAISLLCSLEATAHAGEKTLGVAGGFASFNKAGQANVYFQYSFTPHIRLAPEIGYVFRNKGKSAFECSVDLHFPFRVARGIKLYPLTGLTVNNWDIKYNERFSRCGVDLGGGMDLYLTSSLKFSVQGKYSFMRNTKGCFLQLGLGYVF